MSSKAKRCITGFNVEWISLVDSPANQKKIILKSTKAKPEAEIRKEWNFPITKSDTDKRIVYGLVAVPGEVDTDGDIYTAMAVEKAMEQFMSYGYTQYIDREHDYEVRDAFVRESWLVKENDPFFKEVGAWAVGIKVRSDDLWDVVKSGAVNGLSLAGWAYESTDPDAYGEITKDGVITKAGKTISAATKSALETAFSSLVSAIDGIKGLLDVEEKNQKKEDVEDMTKEEMQALMKGAFDEAVAPIKADIENLKKSMEKEPEGKLENQPTTDGKEAIQKSDGGTVEQPPAVVSKEDVAAIVKSAVIESVKPLQDELDLIKKSGFMRAITENQGEKVEKSVWAGSGIIPGR